MCEAFRAATMQEINIYFKGEQNNNSYVSRETQHLLFHSKQKNEVKSLS
jgi:hypothetical protein